MLPWHVTSDDVAKGAVRHYLADCDITCLGDPIITHMDFQPEADDKDEDAEAEV